MSLSRMILCAGVLVGLSAAPAAAQQPAPVAGTEWVGKETLDGFGNLTFRFQGQGQVTMIDAAGTTPGAYRQNGAAVVLSFFEGKVIYQGKIIGDEMGGEAINTNGNVRWFWKVRRQGAPPAGGNIAQPPAQGHPAGGPGTGAPTPPPGPGPGPGTPMPGQPQPGNNRVTAENLPEYLKQVGFEPRVVRPEVGDPYCVLSLKDKDNWTYQVEVTVQQNGGIFLTCVLKQLPASERIPAAKLLQLLEANHLVGPCHFSYRAADNCLCLRIEAVGARPPAESFRRDLSNLLAVVRRSHSLWNWADAGQPAPAE